MIHHLYEQGSEEWRSVRRGLITGSMFKVARERLKNGKPSKACEQYAMDLAIERCGGVTAEKFQSFHMRQGTEQEPVARAAYEAATGNSVNVVGFFSDDVGSFGCSPDGLIGEDGVLEIKTAVSSATFFQAAVDEDLSEYMDQCLGYLWMLGREWVDLCIWRPDFPHLHIKRIQRSEVTNDIDSLERDMLEFSQIVAGYEAKLKGVLSGETVGQQAEDERRREEARSLAEANAKVKAEAEAAARQWAERVIETPVAVAPAAPQPALEAANTSAVPATGPMLKLGEINARLAPISITVDGLAQLGFTPAATDKASRLYRATDLPLILAAMVQHLNGVGVDLLQAA